MANVIRRGSDPAIPPEEGGGNNRTGGGIQGNINDWIRQILGGDFSNTPLYGELTDPRYSDPTQDPIYQNIIDQMQREGQEDWLGEVAALNEQAEGAGRYGGGMYQAMRVRETEEANEAFQQAMSQMLMGAKEAERNRRAGLFNSMLGAQSNAARTGADYDVGIRNSRANMLGARASMKNANTGAASFRFNKDMTLAGAQQDALYDYMRMIGMTGQLGGSSTQPGIYSPATDPWMNAVAGGWGGYLSQKGTQYDNDSNWA